MKLYFIFNFIFLLGYASLSISAHQDPSEATEKLYSALRSYTAQSGNDFSKLADLLRRDLLTQEGCSFTGTRAEKDGALREFFYSFSGSPKEWSLRTHHIHQTVIAGLKSAGFTPDKNPDCFLFRSIEGVEMGVLWCIVAGANIAHKLKPDYVRPIVSYLLKKWDSNLLRSESFPAMVQFLMMPPTKESQQRLERTGFQFITHSTDHAISMKAGVKTAPLPVLAAPASGGNHPVPGVGTALPAPRTVEASAILEETSSDEEEKESPSKREHFKKKSRRKKSKQAAIPNQRGKYNF